MRGHEGLHVPAHVVETHRVDRGHAHRPFHALLGGAEAHPRVLEALEQITTGLEEDAPGFRGHEGPS